MSPTEHQEPGRKSGAARRLEIADAAMRVLVARGARGFTAKAVADTIGVTDGALFRHFRSMEDIVEAVIERMESALFGDFPPPHDDPIDRLHAFFDRRIASVLAQPDLSRLLFSDHLAQLGGERSAARIEEFKRRSHRFVLDGLQEAASRGLLAPGLEPEPAAILVIGAIHGIGHAGTRLRTGRAALRLAERVWTVLEGTLRGTAVGSPARKSRRRP
jgi:AcrR family transcriptional regulator